MTEHKYMAKKRAIVKMLAILAFIWACLLGMLYLLVERGYPLTTESVLSAPLVVLSAIVIFWYTSRETYRMLYTPQIIMTNTMLILGYGKTILNWEDINRINTTKNTLTVLKRGKIFKKWQDSIQDIADKSGLIRDLERQCMERNIIITRETSFFFR